MSDNVLPVGYTEALGWAAINRHQLGLGIDCVLAAASHALDDNRLARRYWRSHEEKIQDLRALSGRRGLKIGWSRAARSIADIAEELDKTYRNAGAAPLYSRGAGPLDKSLRELSAKAGIRTAELNMTVRKIEELADSFQVEAAKACRLATAMLSV